MTLARLKIFGSSKRGATICMPTGSPFRVRPAGALAAGRLMSVIRKAGAIQSTYFTPLTLQTKDTITPRQCWTLDDLK